jgi:lysophospholipase L1-like esterase
VRAGLRRAGCLLLPLAMTLVAYGSSPVARSATKPSPGGGALAVRVAVVGDSITEMDSIDFDDGLIGSGSWAATAQGHNMDVVGGWAHGGATTGDMLDGVHAMAADVLVVLAGSNDIDAGVTPDVIQANLVQIVARAAVPRVILSSVPPESGYEADAAALNSRLSALAGQQGWTFVDTMAGLRDGDGAWLPGMSDDGVHPSPEGADHIAASIEAALPRP